jgi:hypothetical protein
MSSTLRRTKTLESAISFCILALLTLIVAVILGAQLKTTKTTTIASLNPAGFKALSAAESYNPDNLYEKINGKATFYFDSGFSSLQTQRFASTTDPNLWMELFIYDMAGSDNAFSAYSRQRRPESQNLPDIQFAYKTGNSAYLITDRYYIEIIGSTESPVLLLAIEELAQKTHSAFAKEDKIKIGLLDLFPTKGLIPESIKLYPTDTFGFSELNDTYTAQYSVGDQTVTVFFSKRKDASQAGGIAEKYYNFLIEAGCSPKQVTDPTLQTLKAKAIDAFGVTEILLTTGSFLVGIHETENQPAAEQVLIKLIENLRDSEKSK